MLFGLVGYGETIAVQSLNVVTNMALEGRFRRTLYDSLDTLLPSFEALLVSATMHAFICRWCVKSSLLTDFTGIIITYH